MSIVSSPRAELWSPGFLGAGAVVLAAFGLTTGTIATLAAAVCLVSVPGAFVLGVLAPGRPAQLLGLAHLGLVVALGFTAQGHDLRYTLAGVLLAISGLHGARAATRRDHIVALAIQLAVLSSGLSQLDGSAHGVAIAWLGLWLLTAAPQLRLAAPDGGRLDAREVRRMSLHVTAVIVVGALAWLVLPHPPSHQPQELNDGSASQASSPGSAGAPGAARVGLAHSNTMDLDLRGAGSTTPEDLIDGAPALWRAQIFDRYDGTSWLRDAGDSQSLARTRTNQIPLPDFTGDVSAHTTITVHALADDAGGSVLSAGQPLTLSIPATAALRVPLYDVLGDLTLFTSSGESYTTVGGAPGPDAHAGAAPAVASDWLQLPSSLPGRVRTLAASWTAGAADPQAKADAIDAHLQAGYTYDLDSPIPAPGEDAVDDMLFNSRSGFCEQFAASTAVLLRSLGVPARVVSGYAYGAPADADQYTFGTAGPHQLVRDSDAHAWVEFWEPGKGWIANDPTAGIPLAPEHPVVHEHRTNALLRALQRVPWWAWTLLGVLVAGAVTTVVPLRRRRPRSRAVSGVAGGLTTYAEVVTAFAELCAALGETGSPRQPSETPADVLLRVPGGWARRGEILPVLERELWGPDTPSGSATTAAAVALRELAAEVRHAALQAV